MDDPKKVTFPPVQPDNKPIEVIPLEPPPQVKPGDKATPVPEHVPCDAPIIEEPNEKD